MKPNKQRQFLMTAEEFTRIYSEEAHGNTYDFHEFYLKVMESINSKIDILVMNSNYFTMLKSLCVAYDKNIEMGNFQNQEINSVPMNKFNSNIDTLNFKGDN